MVTEAPRNTILLGDALQVLQTLPDESVQCVVTSPPYWNLRDYGVPGQYGLERTLDEYLHTMVAVFEEVRRVLRSDGTLWLNVGDSYAGSWGNYAPGGIKSQQREQHPGGERWERKAYGDTTRLPAAANAKASGLKPKDLIGMPWRIAFALQASGWWLRSDIIWSKPAPMPESVRDRPTRAHEYLFLMAKSERYFYDADAIREPLRPKTFTTYGTTRKPLGNDALGKVRADNMSHSMPMRVPSGWDTSTGEGGHGNFHKDGRAHRDKQRGHSRRHDGFNGRWDSMSKEEQQANGANKRDVWTVQTAGFPGAHFATFPEALIEPCIMAGSKPDDLVLDPFMGAGTLGVVCRRLGRDYLGIEINPAYVEMAEKRIEAVQQPMLLYSPRGSSQQEAV